MATVAEWLLRGFAVHGCDAIFLNPGTDTPPVQEAYAWLSRRQEKLPKLVTCPHEIVAVAAAQGAYLTTGRAQVAFVHVDVGTANAAGALNDARASQIPVVVCAGMSPSTLSSSVRGSRSKFINWHQDVPDQAALVRNYVKWSQTVAHPSAVGPAVDRAFQIANSEPQGPVYMALPRETLMAEVDDGGLLGPARIRPVRQGALAPAAAERIVEAVLAAEFPVITTAYAGRTPAARHQLVELADRLCAAIVEYRGRFNAPLAHPLHLGFNPEAHLAEADLVLVVDHDVPFVPADLPLRPGARLIHIGNDPIQQRWVTWGFPADEVFSVNVVDALEVLVAAAGRRAGEAGARLAARRRRIEAKHEAMVAELGRRLERAAASAGIAPIEVGALLARIAPEAVVIEEAVTSGNPFAYGFAPGEEGAYYRNGGSYLGWGLGAAIGAKLGDPARLVAAVVGDGSFMFAVPTAALWVSSRYRLPVLIIVLNNESYNSVVLASEQAYPDGAQVEFGHVGSHLPDTPAFERIAEACGGWGRRVTRRQELEPALREAVAAVRAGTTAVLNVMIEAAKKPL